MIHALEISGIAERKPIIRLLNNSGHHAHEFKSVLDFVNRHQGLSYAEEQMNVYATSALKELEAFPNIEIRDSLSAFVDYTILRNK